MSQTPLQFDIHIADGDADAERLDELTGFLRQELLDLGVDSATRTSAGPAPDGSKGEAFSLGALALAAVPAMLPGLMTFLHSWTARGGNRTVTIKTADGMEVSFVPDKPLSQAELLELVQKLSTGGGSAPAASPQSARSRLLELLTTRLGEGELQTFCFELDVDYALLPGEGLSNKARELLIYLGHRDRIAALVAVGRRLRPDVPWDTAQ